MSSSGGSLGKRESRQCWWMHAMIAVWLLFTVVLFVAEPLILHRWLLARAKVKPEATFRFLEWLHWVWLILVWSLLPGRRQPWSAAVPSLF